MTRERQLQRQAMADEHILQREPRTPLMHAAESVEHREASNQNDTKVFFAQARPMMQCISLVYIYNNIYNMVRTSPVRRYIHCTATRNIFRRLHEETSALSGTTCTIIA